MLTTQRRAFALIVVGAAVAAFMWMPRLGDAQSTPIASPAVADDAEVMRIGEEIFTSVCIACHQAGGMGFDGIFPALSGNPFVNLEDARPVVSVVLNGRGGMPRFGGSYSDEEIAGIVTYIRNSFGNQAGPVSPDFVAEVRASFDTLPVAEASPTPEGQQPQGQTEGTPDPEGTPAQ